MILSEYLNYVSSRFLLYQAFIRTSAPDSSASVHKEKIILIISLAQFTCGIFVHISLTLYALLFHLPTRWSQIIVRFSLCVPFDNINRLITSLYGVCHSYMQAFCRLLVFWNYVSPSLISTGFI